MRITSFLVASLAVTMLIVSLLVLAQRTLTSTSQEKQTNVNNKSENNKNPDNNSIKSWFSLANLMRSITRLLNLEVQETNLLSKSNAFQRVPQGYLNYNKSQQEQSESFNVTKEVAAAPANYRSQRSDQTLISSIYLNSHPQLSATNHVSNNYNPKPSALVKDSEYFLSLNNMTKTTSLDLGAVAQQKLIKCHTNKFDRLIAQKASTNNLSRPIIDSSGRFDNPFTETWKQPSLLEVAKFVVLEPDDSSVPKNQAELEKELPLLRPDFRAGPSDGNYKVTWIGHSTLLIQIDGLNILTDPIFSDRASFTQYFGPKRIREPACDIKSLPRIDIVLISHNHYDHLDSNSVKQLTDRFGSACRWIVPLGLGEYFQSMSVENYVELDWWQKDCYHIDSQKVSQQPLNLRKDSSNKSSKETSSLLGEQQGFDSPIGLTNENELTVYLTPTQHWTRRGVADICKTLWGSFVIVSKSGSTFFFGGDTAYCSVFKEIGEVFGPFTGAAIPIGAYKPRWFLKYSHVDPAEAVQIHRELRSMKSIAIHHSTFILSNEHYKEPAKLLNSIMLDLKVKGLVKEPFLALKHGEAVNFSMIS